MRDYKVEVYFKGDGVISEKSYHYDCDNEDEAIQEALENIDILRAFKIYDVECHEID